MFMMLTDAILTLDDETTLLFVQFWLFFLILKSILDELFASDVAFDIVHQLLSFMVKLVHAS